jgi:hypothetical protein
MKIFLCLLIIFVNFSYALPKVYSVATEDGYNEAMDELGDEIEKLNDEVKEFYKDLKKNQIKAISDAFANKSRILKNMQNLSREDDITNTNQLYEIKLKLELDGLLIDAWSVE